MVFYLAFTYFPYIFVAINQVFLKPIGHEIIQIVNSDYGVVPDYITGTGAVGC